MPQLTLYHATPSRSSIALWILEEIGEPHDVKLLNVARFKDRPGLKRAEVKDAEFRKQSGG